MASNDPDIVSPGRGADAPHGHPGASARPFVDDLTTSQGGTACFMRRARLLDPALADEIAVALKGDWTSASLLRALRKRGVPTGKESLAMHRRGDCPQCQTS